MSIRVGTRGSALATTQTSMVARRLEELTGQVVELVQIRTEGDVRTGSLASLGGTGVFVTALRDALLTGRCDVAVHSLKDLPTAPMPGLHLVTPERENPRDALCAASGATVETLPKGARVGTGSPRRVAQLRFIRPDLDIVDIRGNVDTRLGRVHGPSADLDAVILAYAGLARLGRTDAVSEILDFSVMLPAPGQGALAIEVPVKALATGPLGAALTQLDHTPTHLAVDAERAVLARLEAGCAAPVGANATVTEEELSLEAIVVALNGTDRLHYSESVPLVPGAEGQVAHDLGFRVADALLAGGAASLAPLTTAGAEPTP